MYKTASDFLMSRIIQRESTPLTVIIPILLILRHIVKSWQLLHTES